MARTSVTVSDQKANAAFVASALTIYREPVIAGLLANNAVLAPEDRIDAAVLQQFLTWAGKLLQQKSDALSTAESAYVSEQADDGPVRSERDDRHESLSGQMIRVRDRVEAHLGRDSLATYGLADRTPRTVQDLLVYVQTAVKLLREQERLVPDGMGGVLSTVTLAASLEGMCSELEASARQMLQEQRELAAARIARNTAQDELAAMYQMIAGLLVYVFRLAGQDELAERVRPVRVARRSRAPEDDTTLPPPNDGGDPVAAPGDGDGPADPAPAPGAPAANPRR